MSIEKATVLKIDQNDHIKQLQKSGLIFMNNLKYFWEVEDVQLRGDPLDGIAEIQKGSHGKIMIENKEISIQSWTLNIHPEHPENINIFCMYADSYT